MSYTEKSEKNWVTGASNHQGLVSVFKSRDRSSDSSRHLTAQPAQRISVTAAHTGRALLLHLTGYTCITATFVFFTYCLILEHLGTLN